MKDGIRLKQRVAVARLEKAVLNILALGNT
jgi:hypothetical protein